MSLPEVGRRYEILDLLGEGGSARVYRALDRLHGNEVALKVLDGAAVRGRGLHGAAEFRLLASHRHPHIVRVLDFGTSSAADRPSSEAVPFFTLELLGGRDLLAFARTVLSAAVESPGTPTALDAAVLQVLEALDYIHTREILHLDLKPSNVLVNRTGSGVPLAKLLDFGLARASARELPGLSGTVEYLAPERIEGRPVGPRADLYSLGVLLYELFTGCCPFVGSDPAAVARAHLSAAPPEAEDLPEAFRPTVLRLLEKDPSARPRSAWETRVLLYGEEPIDVSPLPPFGAEVVGREGLLVDLEDSVRRAAAGDSSALLLEGGVGVGKSRLLRELEVRLQLDGVAVGLEGCRAGAARPGDLLVRLLHRAALHVDPRGELESCTELALALERLSVGREDGDNGPVASSGPSRGALRSSAEESVRREALLHRTARALTAAAREHPLVFLIDDAHHLDSLSRDGLVALLRLLGPASDTGLFVVLATREAVAGAGEPFEGLAGAATRTVRLGDLTETAVARYVRQVFGATPRGGFPEGGAITSDAAAISSEPGETSPDVLAASLAERLVAQTGGNIYFIEEHLKRLIRAGAIRRGLRGAWEVTARATDVDAVPTAATVEEAVAARVAGIRGLERKVLEWVVVFGDPIDETTLLGLLVGPDGLDAEDRLGVQAVLERLCYEQLLSREGSRWVVPYAVLRDVVAASLGSAERQDRHERIATELEAQATRAEDPRSCEPLARHWYGSNQPLRAKPFLLAAAEQARRAGALREAADQYGRALEQTRDDEGRFFILAARQEVLGNLGRRKQQEEDLDELAVLAARRGDDDSHRDVEVRRALHLESIGDQRAALEVLRNALNLGTPTAAERIRIELRLGLLRLNLADFEAALETFQEASVAARESRERGLEGECLQFLGLAHYRRGEYDKAVRLLGESLALLREQDAPHRLGAVESNLGLVHYDRGDFEAAEERFRASLKTFRRLGLRRGEAVNLLNLGLASLAMGRYESALRGISESIAIRRELGDRRAEGSGLGNLGEVWWRLGRFERAASLAQQALERAREVGNRQSEAANLSLRGLVAVDRGDFASGGETLVEALALAEELGLVTEQVRALLGLARLGLAAASGGDRSERLAKSREQANRAATLSDEGHLFSLGLSALEVLAAVELEAGELQAAERTTGLAVQQLLGCTGRLADAHLVWLTRYRVLEARRRVVLAEAGVTTALEQAGEDALRRAYALLRESADSFEDDELRRAFLENPPAHREIARLHEDLQGSIRRDTVRRERSFHEIARTLHSIHEVDPLLDRLLQLAIETTHAEKGLILLRAPDGSFTARAAHGMPRESVEDATDICRSVVSDVTGGGEPVLAVDAGSDARFRERRSIISFQIRTLMCVPLRLRDEVIGAVYVDGRGAASFQEPDLEYLVAFAQLAAVAVDNARLLETLRAENQALRREVETRYRFENLLAESPAMEPVLRVLEKVARTSASILIAGETGTGKEVVARAIHYASERRSRPFVAIDCGALPENLLESELFGHRRGAFSGAFHDRVGLFEEAAEGTLFLDEVTNTSLDLQAKLLRVLQEGEIRRLGDNATRKVDVRILAASNVRLEDAVGEGKFREDLFYRLNVVTLEIPPLRERPEDIPLLAKHFLKRACERHGKTETIVGFDGEALRLLESLPWKGNVRELENFVEKAIILAEEARLSARFLRELLGLGPAPLSAPPPTEELAVSAVATGLQPSPEAATRGPALTLEEFDRRWLAAEEHYLRDLVRDAGGNLSKAARQAGVRHRNTLVSRLNKHGIRRQR